MIEGVNPLNHFRARVRVQRTPTGRLLGAAVMIPAEIISEFIKDNTETLADCIAYVKEHGIEYMDLYGKNIVDIAVKVICGYLFCQQASSKVDMETAVDKNGKTMSMKARKAMIAKRYITKNNPSIAAWTTLIKSGNKSSFDNYEEIAGAVPELV